jgi:MFS family permease
VKQPAQAGGLLIAALGITQIIGYGSVFYSFSPLMQPLQHGLAAGKGTIVGAFSLALLAAAGCAIFVGRAIDRNGGRRVMAAGSAVAGLLLIALGFADSIAGLYIIYAGLGVAMAAILYEPAFAVLTHAFGPEARRAITALTLIAGFASTVFWPLTQFLVDTFGWRHAVMLLGAANLLVCLPLHARVIPAGRRLKRTAAAGGTSTPDSGLAQAIRSPVFHAFAGALVCNGLIFAAMSVHVIPILEAKGLSALAAAGFAALIGPMQVTGRVLEVTVGRRFPVARVGLVALGVMPLALFLLWAAREGGWLIAAFALLYGASNGVFTIVRGAMPMELFGRSHYGAINGALSAPYLISHASGPLLGAYAWTAFGGNYDAMIAALALVSLTGLLLFLAATRLHAMRSGHAGKKDPRAGER